jgi:hypothetical protein
MVANIAMANIGASCENGFRGALSVGAVPETVAARLGAGKQRSVFHFLS